MQCIATSPVRTYMNVFTGYPNDEDYNIFVKIFFSLVEIVNLDFFRLAYSPVCLHPNMNVFEIESLEYIIALYPFLLVFITYFLITAYDSQYRLFVWIWKPFKVCILRYRKTWNIRTSLIEIFASFILLSSVRIMRASFNILSFTFTYDIAGNKVSTVVSTSVNIKYFSSQHLPFALLAITHLHFCCPTSSPSGPVPLSLLPQVPQLLWTQAPSNAHLHGRLPGELQATATRHAMLLCFLPVSTDADNAHKAISITTDPVHIRGHLTGISCCGGCILTFQSGSSQYNRLHLTLSCR